MRTKLKITLSYEDVMGLLLDIREFQDICKDRSKAEYANAEKWAKRFEAVEIRKMRLVGEVAKERVVK